MQSPHSPAVNNVPVVQEYTALIKELPQERIQARAFLRFNEVPFPITPQFTLNKARTYRRGASRRGPDGDAVVTTPASAKSSVSSQSMYASIVANEGRPTSMAERLEAIKLEMRASTQEEARAALPDGAATATATTTTCDGAADGVYTKPATIDVTLPYMQSPTTEQVCSMALSQNVQYPLGDLEHTVHILCDPEQHSGARPNKDDPVVTLHRIATQQGRFFAHAHDTAVRLFEYLTSPPDGEVAGNVHDHSTNVHKPLDCEMPHGEQRNELLLQDRYIQVSRHVLRTFAAQLKVVDAKIDATHRLQESITNVLLTKELQRQKELQGIMLKGGQRATELAVERATARHTLDQAEEEPLQLRKTETDAELVIREASKHELKTYIEARPRRHCFGPVLARREALHPHLPPPRTNTHTCHTDRMLIVACNPMFIPVFRPSTSGSCG